MIYQTTTIACDHITTIQAAPPLIRRCREEITVETPNYTEARQQARRQGWSFRKGPHDYCPTHTPEHQP